MSDQPKVESTIRDVAIQSVSTKPIQEGTKTLWLIQTVGGPEVSTIRAELGNAARTLWESGQAADMIVTVVQKGKYTNYYLEKIQVAKSGATTPVRQAIQKAQETQEITFDKFAGVEREKNSAIHRQTAAKVSATLFAADQTGGSQAFWANVEDLCRFFDTGETPIASAAKMATTPEPEPPQNDFFETTQVEDDIPF